MTVQAEHTNALPAWLDLAKIVSAETRDELEMVIQGLEDLLLIEMGTIIRSVAEVTKKLDDELDKANLTDDLLVLVRELIGAEKMAELCALAVDVLVDVVGGTPGNDWVARSARKYPDVAKRLGIEVKS
jgi:hypothetical protein